MIFPVDYHHHLEDILTLRIRFRFGRTKTERVHNKKGFSIRKTLRWFCARICFPFVRITFTKHTQTHTQVNIEIYLWFTDDYICICSIGWGTVWRTRVAELNFLAQEGIYTKPSRLSQTNQIKISFRLCEQRTIWWTAKLVDFEAKTPYQTRHLSWVSRMVRARGVGFLRKMRRTSFASTTV